MRRGRSQAGTTLIEVLIAVTLLSFLSVAMAFALRIGINAYQKTGAKLMENRRVTGAQRILEEELEGMVPSVAPCGPQTSPSAQPDGNWFAFFQASPSSMRLVSTFSLQEAWRGRPQVLEFFVIPRDDGPGVRLVVNEVPYYGPLSAGRLCTTMAADPISGIKLPQFLPVRAGTQSFVLADKLAYCRFNYLWQPPKFDPQNPVVWSPTAINSGWPLAVRVEMAPLAMDLGTLQPLTVTAALHLHLSPTIPYGEFKQSVAKSRTPLTTVRRSVPYRAATVRERFLTRPASQPVAHALLRECVRHKRHKGSALLAVMWLSAALAAFGFSLASTVRGEIERASTDLDSLRAYYVATGAIERASLELLWSVSNPKQRLIPQATNFIDYAFETGVAHVEFLPEAGKLNANLITGEELTRLLLALGVEPQRASVIAAGTIAWRKPGIATIGGPMNPGAPTFELPHASFQGIEEMLNVQGVTPEIFYGTYVPAPAGMPAGAPRLEARPGLVDCLSVFGAKDTIDVNTAQPAVMAALGVAPATIGFILERRRLQPFTTQNVNSLGSAGAAHFKAEGNSIVTIRATAQVRLPNGGFSDVKRTVAAMVKYMPPGYDSPIHVLRWYDTAFSDSRWTLAPLPVPFAAIAPPVAPGGSN